MLWSKNEMYKCPCCGLDNVKPQLKQLLKPLHDIRITSGTRCQNHNAAVGGSKTSSHLTGWAADISTPNSRIRYQILSHLLTHNAHRIGIAKTFIHVDLDPSKDPEVVWLY